LVSTRVHRASGSWPEPPRLTFLPPGAVEMFRRSGAHWVHTQRLLAPSPQASDAFGDQTAIEGDLLAVGAFGANVNNVEGGGQVHLYRLVEDRWQHELTIDCPELAEKIGFGHFVEIDQGRVYVGEVRNHETGGWSQNQAVYEFSHNGTTWELSNTIRPPADLHVPAEYLEVARQQNAARGTGFGNHLDVDGDVMAISAMGAGTVLLYDRVGENWVHKETLTDPSGNDTAYGRTVSIDGGTLVTGALSADGAVARSGLVYTYQRLGGRWQLRQTLQAPDATSGDMFGHWADISRNIMIVGAFRYTGSAAPQSGAAFVYKLAGGRWTFERMLAPSAGRASQFAAYAVEVDGDTVVFTSGDEMGAARGDSILVNGGIWAQSLDGS
jgi:hypothetical protein